MNQFPDFIDIMEWGKNKKTGRIVPHRMKADGSGELETCEINVGNFVKLKNGEGYHYNVGR